MHINGINSNVPFSGIPEKAEKDKTVSSEQKNVRASALNLTDAYGRASIVMQNKQPKYIKEMTDGEFRRLNRNLLTSAEEISKDLYEKLDCFSFSKNNILIIQDIISDKRLYSNETLVKNADNFAVDITNPYQSELVQRILSDDNLLNNDNFMSKSGQLISSVDCKERFIYAEKLLSEEKLYSDNNVMKYIKDVISGIETEENLELKLDITNKILSDENLYNNQNVKENLGYILSGVKNQNQYDIADKILSDEILVNNKNISDALYYITDLSDSDERASITKKVLSDEKYYNDKKIMSNLNSILSSANTKYQAEIAKELINEAGKFDKDSFRDLTFAVSSGRTKMQYTLVNKILSDEKLYTNENVLKNTGIIIQNTTNPRQYKLAERILTDENLFGSEPLMTYAGYILSDVDSADRSKIAEIIISNKDLYDNPDIIYNATAIIKEIDTKEKADFSEKVLSDKRFFEKKVFMTKAPDLIKEISSKEKLNAAISLIDNEDILNNEKFFEYYPLILSEAKNEETSEKIIQNTQLVSSGEILPSQFFMIYDSNGEITSQKALRLNKTVGKERAEQYSLSDTRLAVKNLDLYGKKSINELTRQQKHDFLNMLVSSDMSLMHMSDNLKTDFPILPDTRDKYENAVKTASAEVKIKVKPLSLEENEEFDLTVKNLSKKLAALSDEEFNSLKIKHTYDKKEFISDCIRLTENLPEEERQKIYDYYGFELGFNKTGEYKNKNGYGISLTGYPSSEGNNEKLSKITNPETICAIEKLQPYVVKFSKDNQVSSGNKELDKELNKLLEFIPELRSCVGRHQHLTQSFDLFKHSLKVMQKISQDKSFNTFDERDKKILLIASLLHDITKTEGSVDKKHPEKSAFDAYYIAGKFDLSDEEKNKLYTLIKNHEWLAYVNTSTSDEDTEERLINTAYDLKDGNTFDAALLFTHADLKAIKTTDIFHDIQTGKGRTDYKGNNRSFGESADYYGNIIKEKIAELKKSTPLFPVTEFPKASDIDKAITEIRPDGSTDIKGIYKDKNGVTYIKFNEVEDWEKAGFPKGSISKGIITTTERGESVNTGNIHFFVHALDNGSELVKFDAFSLPDSDALLSLSYAERPESKYDFFRPQGIIIDCLAENIEGGGGPNNMGTGLKKNTKDFKNDYIKGGQSKADREWISRQIKGSAGMSDEEYVNFVEKNKNKPFSDIMPEELRNKIIETFSSMNSNPVCGNRAYNEIFASRIKPPFAVFSTSGPNREPTGNPAEFFNSETKGINFDYKTGTIISAKQRTEFLRKYALEHDIPFVVFGD